MTMPFVHHYRTQRHLPVLDEGIYSYAYNVEAS